MGSGLFRYINSIICFNNKDWNCYAHGTNFMDSADGQDDLTSNSRNYIELSKGDIWSQSSSEKWQKDFR